MSNGTCTYAPEGLRQSAHRGGAANPVSFVWDGDDLLNEHRSGGASCRDADARSGVRNEAQP